jgi:hypothetical protein
LRLKLRLNENKAVRKGVCVEGRREVAMGERVEKGKVKKKRG